MRTRPYHTEAGATDMLSFNVACDPPGNMVAAIAGSRGPRGYMGRWNGPRYKVNFPEEFEFYISI